MKRRTMVVFLVILFFWGSVPSLFGDAADDYKVIKKAVTGKKASKDLNFFKILVVDNYSKKVRVRITLPISLIDLIAECSDDSFEVDNHCRIDLKEILRALRKAGPMSLIEVNNEDESVKIWFE
jgi:hypothetical protein